MSILDELARKLVICGYTLVLSDGRETITSCRRGVAPLLGLIEEKRDVSGWYAADKAVGKAAAALYAVLGVAGVYACRISEAGLAMLRKCGIAAVYDSLVPVMKDRSGNGICPMEDATADLASPEECLEAIKKKAALLAVRTIR